MNSASSANHDKIQQESIPGGCVLPAHHRTGRFSVQRGLRTETLLGTETPEQRPPQRETLLVSDPLDIDPTNQRPPGQKPSMDRDHP